MHHMRSLGTQTLAELTMADGRPLAAASGLVCRHGRVFVVGDDALHLGVFASSHRPGHWHRLLAGELPTDVAARKRAKPDFEVLMPWPKGLLALGSGSLPQRQQAVFVPLHRGEPGRAQAFSLAPLYERLQAALGPLNIEGAVQLGSHCLLLQRGNAGQSGNGVVRLARSVLAGCQSHQPALRARWLWVPMALGHLDGVPLGLTDGCAIDAQHWLFTAAAEDTADAVADGPCRGSILGLADAQCRVLRRWRLPPGLKVEGVDARRWADGRITLVMVTDADDPLRPALLLRAELRLDQAAL